MALYSNIRYAIHTEFVLGYLAMFLACLALICALSSYTSCLLRPDDLGKDIGSLYFRAYLSILPVNPKGGDPGVLRGMRDPLDMTVLHGLTGVDRRW